MIIIGVPALVCLVGLLMYALATNGKLVRIGEIMFFCGLLAMLLTMPEAIKLIR